MCVLPGVLLSALVTQVVDSITALEDISSTAAQRLSALLRMTEEKGAPLLVDANGEPHAPAKVRASQSSFLNFFFTISYRMPGTNRMCGSL